MAGVGAVGLLIGTGTAWLVTMYRFPGRRMVEWLPFLPLAVLTYIIAFLLPRAVRLFGRGADFFAPIACLPFNFDTLATQVFTLASLYRYEEAGLSALTIVL